MIQTWRYAGTDETRCFGWFIAFVDSTGCVAVCSDYGDWAHRWHEGALPSGGIRRFLQHADSGYIAGKLAGGRRELQVEESVKVLREAILYGRRNEDWDAEACRETWDALDYVNDEHELLFAVRDSALPEFYEHLVYDKPAELRAFMKEVWPRLVVLISQQLKEEGDGAGG